MREICVYIASPYTNGWMPFNVKLQLKISDELMDLGYYPYVPLLSHFQEIYSSRSECEWMKLDFVFLKKCNAVLRLKSIGKDGKEIPSKGADKEVALAIKEGIPLFYSIEELNDWAKASSKQYTL